MPGSGGRNGSGEKLYFYSGKIEAKGGEAAVSLDTDGSDINIEYKTHTLGRPDGEDNIDGDWELSEEEMYPAGEELTLPEEERLISAKIKKCKKHKKGKKDKKKKKNKK